MKNLFTILLLALCVSVGYSQTVGIKISQLPANTSILNRQNVLPIVNNNITKRVTIGNLLDSCGYAPTFNSGLNVDTPFSIRHRDGLTDLTGWKLVFMTTTLGTIGRDTLSPCDRINACALASGSFWKVTGNAGTSSASNFIGTTDNVSFRTKTNNVYRMVVDSLGKVGIGTQTPTELLDVQINGTYFTVGRTAPDNGIYGKADNVGFEAGLTDFLMDSAANEIILNGTGGGNVGIGTASPTATLYVVGTGHIGNAAGHTIFDVDNDAIVGLAADVDFISGTVLFGADSANGSFYITDGTQGTGKVLTSDASGNASWTTISTPTSGQYLPVDSALVGGSSLTMDSARWYRCDNIVTVSGKFTVTKNSNASCVFDISLPIGTNASSAASINGNINGSIGFNQAGTLWVPSGTIATSSTQKATLSIAQVGILATATSSAIGYTYIFTYPIVE